MLRRLVLVSGLMVAGAFGFAGSASAQVSENAEFTGTILSACAVAQTTPGTLATTDGLTLSSSVGSGTPAVMEITCPDGDVTVTAPVEDAAVTPNQAGAATTTNAATLTAVIGTVTNTADSAGATFTIPTAQTTAVTAEVEMTATSTTPLPVGPYAYTVEVTVTP